MQRLVSSWIADESGAAAIEYGLIVSLISVAIIGVLLSVGINLNERLQEIADAIGSALTKGGSH